MRIDISSPHSMKLNTTPHTVIKSTVLEQFEKKNPSALHIFAMLSSFSSTNLPFSVAYQYQSSFLWFISINLPFCGLSVSIFLSVAYQYQSSILYGLTESRSLSLWLNTINLPFSMAEQNQSSFIYGYKVSSSLSIWLNRINLPFSTANLYFNNYLTYIL